METGSDDASPKVRTTLAERLVRATRTVDLGGPPPKRIFDQVSIVAIVLDPNLRVVRYNRAAERLFGKPFANVLNRAYAESVPTLADVNRSQVFQRTLALGVPAEVKEVEIKEPRSGVTFYFDFVIDPILGDDAQIGGISLIGLDVTERAKLRRQLAEQNEDLKALQQVSDWLRKTMDLEKAFFITASALTSAEGGYDHAMIFTVDQDREFLVGRSCVDSLKLSEVWGIWRGLTSHDAPLQKSLETMQPVLARRWGELTEMIKQVKVPLNDPKSILVHALRNQVTITHRTLDDEPELRVHPAIKQHFELQSFAAAPLMAENEAIGVVLVESRRPRDFTPEQLTMLEMFTGQAALAINNGMIFQNVLERAQRDSLTRLYNHGHFQEALRNEIDRAGRYGNPLSVIMLDIDHFKRFNDTWGHQTGDRVLKQTALLLSALVRVTDLPARYGGEEFALLLPQTDYAHAMELAERLRVGVERKVVVSGPKGEKIGVTASFGVATFPKYAEDAAGLVSIADEALYYSKEKGRNCISGAHEVSAQAQETRKRLKEARKTKKLSKPVITQVKSTAVSPPPKKSTSSSSRNKRSGKVK
ncbi:MAG: diguanylate cyclase [Planctomycetes bacterium]|nr:diguanylate cyclase [Planctomycetota bacterium]